MGGNREAQVNAHIDRQSNEVARLLDNGRGTQAADLLRDEARNLSPQEFNRLVKRAERRDDKQYGDNLSIVPGEGLIIIDGRKGEILVGRLADERQRRPEPPQHGRRDDARGRAAVTGERSGDVQFPLRYRAGRLNIAATPATTAV